MASPEHIDESLDQRNRERDAELARLRRMRDRIEIWLNAFTTLSLDTFQTTPRGLIQLWAKTMISNLDFEAVGVYRVELDTGRILLMAGKPENQLPQKHTISIDERRLIFDWPRGSFDDGVPHVLAPLSKPLGLNRFHWVTFSSGHGISFLLVAGFFSSHRSLTEGDQELFSMVGNLLAARLDKIILISEVEQDRLDLRKMNIDLDRSLRDLRKTQDELLLSTRLASVGEMAGRTAHEVLNPISSIHGRLTRMMGTLRQVYRENLAVFESVLAAWEEGYEKGGIAELFDMLSKRVSGSSQTFLENDLRCLKSLHQYFSKEAEHQLEGVRFLLHEVDRVVHIVDGMRSLTRQTGSRKREELTPILSEALESLSDAMEKRCIRFHLDCDDRLTLFLDRYELIQVMTNLIRNGMFAIEEKCGREGGDIYVEATSRKDMVDIRVTDTGTGIPEADVPKLFEPSFTSRSKEQGTGLGLSISRRLVYGFGGDISVEKSVIHQGTTFLVTIPSYSKERENRYLSSIQ